MHRILALCLAIAVASPALLSPAPAAAQGDWSVRRDPFDKRIVARYKAILRRNPADKSALGKLTRLYKRYRSLKLLLTEYQRAVKRRPKDYASHVVLGHLYLNSNRQDDALKQYELAATLKPKAAAVQAALGDLYRRSGQLAKAHTAYEAALSSTRSKGLKKQLLRTLADLALSDGNITRARTYYDRYIALDPKNVRARIDLGDALVRHKKFKDAITVYKDAEKRLRRDPYRRVEVISRIGAALEKSGQDDAAVREYRRAMKVLPRAFYLRKELTSRVVDIYRRKQDLKTLLAYYVKTWPARRRKHFHWAILARLYEETGAQENAIAAYRKAVKKSPFELETQRRLITLLENSGQEDAALKQYEAVIKVAPGEPRFQLELAQRYWRRGKEKRALALLKKMTARFSGDGGVHSAIADMYTRWGKEDLALKTHIRLTKIEPHETSHLVNLGEQYFQRNQKKKAVAVWKRIIARKTAANYARLGEVFSDHDMLMEALGMFNKAVKLAPKKSSLFKGRAAVYERQRRYNEAILDWEKVLSLTKKTKANRPARKEARRRVVSLLRRARGSRLAVRQRYWRQSFNGSPPDLEAGYYLVESYLQTRSFSKARVALERILVVDDKDKGAMQTLVKIYRALQKYDKAVALLLRLAKLSPGREREFYTQIAEIKTADKKDDEAIYYALKALQKSPKDPLAHQRLAERYEEMQQFDKAIKAYEKTIELDPRKFKVYFALARLYRTKQPKKTALLYREVLKRSTDTETIRKAGRAAIDIEELNHTLGDLERVMSPLAFTYSHKKIYRRTLVRLYERYVTSLLHARRSGDAAARLAANKELKRLGSHGLKPLLEALSDDKDPRQQRIAVAVLGFLGNKAAAAPLVRLAAKPSRAAPRRRRPAPSPRRHGRRSLRLNPLRPSLNVDVRIDALVAAGRLGDPRTIPDLIKIASNKREVPMREAAIFALGMTRSAKAIAPLLGALDDSSPSVQTLGCLGLAQTGGARATSKLIEVARDRQRNDSARAACAFALGYRANPSAVPALSTIVSHGNDEVQRMAAWALGRIGDKRALPALLSSYFSRHEQVRHAVARTMAGLASGVRTGTESIDLTEYPRRSGKYDAATIIRHLPGQHEIIRLAPALIIGRERALVAGVRDALSRHRDLILRMLRDLDTRPASLGLGPLIARLDEVPASDRARIEAAISRMGTALIDDLAALTKHRDAKVRELAVAVVAKIQAPAVPGLLAAGLADARRGVRGSAMRAVGVYATRVGAPAAPLVAQVTALMKAPQWQSRLDAVTAQARFGRHANVAALTRSLGDRNGFVRESAALALGSVRARAAIPALARTADDTVAAVRWAAVTALADIGGARARKALAKLGKRSSHPDVRRAARRALRKRKK